MNDEKEKSSNQNPLNTTHFNNNINRRNVLNNNQNYNGLKPIAIPKNTSISSDLENNNEKDLVPKKREDNRNINITNDQRQQQSRNYLNNSINDNNSKSRNQFGPKNRVNNSVDKLRNTLNTNPSLKDEAVKKGAEALKKSNNPYAKAAGYAASYIQKRKEKKKEKEDKEEKIEENNDNNESVNEEQESTTEKRATLIKALLPILIFIAPLLFIMIIILCIISPLLNSYSWFYSIFNNNSSDANSYYIYNADKEMLEKEKAFNEAIVGSKDGSVTGIIQRYKDEYGVTLDKNLLIATVTYRFTGKNNEITDITEEDLENIDEKIDNLESSNENNSSNKINVIDYKTAQDNLETVAQLMLIQDGDTYKTDFSVGGAFYNKLIESEFLKSYYKDFLVDTNYDARKDLVDKIYDYADGAREIFGDDELDDTPISGGVIGDTSIVHIQTCDVPYTFQTINGLKVYNNRPWNEGTSYPDYLSLTDYIKGVLKMEVGGHIKSQYIEGLKAHAIISLSYLINDTESGFDLKSGEMYFPAGNCRQVTCSPTNGCSYDHKSVFTNGKYHTAFADPNMSGDGIQHKSPLTAEENSILEQVLNDVFGKVMVKKGVTSASFSGSKDTIHTSFYDSTSTSGCTSGKCLGQQEAMKDAESGMTYDKILHKYYSDIDFDIININEGIYTENAEFADAKFNGKIIYYSQTDYKNKFCGISNETIATSGCGVTAAAIIASSFTGNKKYDPVYMMDWAYKDKYCGKGIYGTLSTFFEEVAKKMGYSYDIAEKKDTNKVVDALKSGKSLVVAHVGPGHFTDGSHFIVLSAINSQGKVYVNDPYNNKSTGYWNINTIANELDGYFHIISIK